MKKINYKELFLSLEPKEAIPLAEKLSTTIQLELMEEAGKLIEMSVFYAIYSISNRDSPTLELDANSVQLVKKQLDGYRKFQMTADITVEDAINADLQISRWKSIWNKMSQREKDSFLLKMEYLKKMDI